MKMSPFSSTILIIALSAINALAAVRFVNVNNAIPAAPYTSWVTAATTIQDAIDAASDGEIVWVTNGVYNSGGQLQSGVSNRVALTKSLTVCSVNGPGVTLIVGAVDTNYFRCAYLTNDAVLSGFTLTNGQLNVVDTTISEQSWGGAARCVSSSSVISNCVLVGGCASTGSGSYCGTLLDCMLTNNVPGTNGFGAVAYSNILVNCSLIWNRRPTTGLLIYEPTTTCGAAYSVLSNCLLAANQSKYGGSLYFCSATQCVISSSSALLGGGSYQSTLQNCLLINNSAQNYGGGAYLGLLNSCVLNSNYAGGFGGGSYSNILNNCVLFRNSTVNEGGGAAGSTLNNCTVVSNDYGGLYFCAANNSIVYYNNHGFAIDNYFPIGSTLNHCCTYPSAGALTNDPGLILTSGDLHLQNNSQCINSGDNALAANSTDLDGNPRIVAGTVDVGAYEFQSPTSVISYAWLQQYGLPTDGSADYADTDGDAHNNWQEWRANTVPTDPSSVLKMLTVSNNTSSVTVSWQSVSNVNYFLQRSSNFGAQSNFLTLVTNITGLAGITSFTDTNVVGDGPFFYRVGVQ
jgi:hypothetical protein